MICEERKRRHGDFRCVDFQTEPWNVILIKQCTWVAVGLGNGASWKLVYKYPHTFVYLL